MPDRLQFFGCTLPLIAAALMLAWQSAYAVTWPRARGAVAAALLLFWLWNVGRAA